MVTAVATVSANAFLEADATTAREASIAMHDALYQECLESLAELLDATTDLLAAVGNGLSNEKSWLDRCAVCVRKGLRVLESGVSDDSLPNVKRARADSVGVVLVTIAQYQKAVMVIMHDIMERNQSSWLMQKKTKSSLQRCIQAFSQCEKELRAQAESIRTCGHADIAVQKKE